MITFIAVVLSLALQAAPAITYPSTPQGKQVEGFVKAFQAGEAAFVTFQGEHMLPARTADQRRTMYARMHQEFGDFTVLTLLSASSDQVTIAVKHPAGLNASFAFSFEKAAPFRIIDMNVQVTQ
ncbi:MAG: hypothetical protein ABI665_10560 [Vicinamibacterales bacterium]